MHAKEARKLTESVLRDRVEAAKVDVAKEKLRLEAAWGYGEQEAKRRINNVFVHVKCAVEQGDDACEYPAADCPRDDFAYSNRYNEGLCHTLVELLHANGYAASYCVTEAGDYRLDISW